MFFLIEHKDKNCNARTGKIKLKHGEVEVPVFMLCQWEHRLLLRL